MNVATLSEEDTLPLTGLFELSLSRIVAAEIVAGSIASLKLTVTALFDPTAVAPLAGLVASTVGGVTSGMRVTVTVARPMLPCKSVAVILMRLFPATRAIVACHV